MFFSTQFIYLFIFNIYILKCYHKKIEKSMQKKRRDYGEKKQNKKQQKNNNTKPA